MFRILPYTRSQKCSNWEPELTEASSGLWDLPPLSDTHQSTKFSGVCDWEAKKTGYEVIHFPCGQPWATFLLGLCHLASCTQSRRANLHPDQTGLCIRPEIKERGLPWLYKGQVILRCIKCGECQGKPPEEKQLQTERPKTRRKTTWKNNSVVLLILED